MCQKLKEMVQLEISSLRQYKGRDRVVAEAQSSEVTMLKKWSANSFAAFVLMSVTSTGSARAVALS